MNTWFSSDHHINHANIIRYCKRPYKNVWEMDEDLITKWNDLIAPEDIVYYLGDFSFRTDRYIGRLNGQITLIRGNHDKAKHLHLFHNVVDSMEMKIAEFRCFLNHYPLEVGRIYKVGAPELGLLKKYDYIICGHIHEKWKVKDKNVNVGVDVWDMKPIRIDELARFLRSLRC